VSRMALSGLRFGLRAPSWKAALTWSLMRRSCMLETLNIKSRSTQWDMRAQNLGGMGRRFFFFFSLRS